MLGWLVGWLVGWLFGWLCPPGLIGTLALLLLWQELLSAPWQVAMAGCHVATAVIGWWVGCSAAASVSAVDLLSSMSSEDGAGWSGHVLLTQLGWIKDVVLDSSGLSGPLVLNPSFYHVQAANGCPGRPKPEEHSCSGVLRTHPLRAARNRARSRSEFAPSPPTSVSSCR